MNGFFFFVSRYLQPPSLWLACALESRELLSLCLKKLKGLNKVHVLQWSKHIVLQKGLHTVLLIKLVNLHVHVNLQIKVKSVF